MLPTRWIHAEAGLVGDRQWFRSVSEISVGASFLADAESTMVIVQRYRLGTLRVRFANARASRELEFRRVSRHSRRHLRPHGIRGRTAALECAQRVGRRPRGGSERTGRVVRTQHVAEWWFALQALDLLAAGGGRPGHLNRVT